MYKMERKIIMRFIDFGTKLPEEMSKIKSICFSKIKEELEVEILNKTTIMERVSIADSGYNSNDCVFQLFKNNEVNDIVGEIQLRYTENSLVMRNECVIKISLDKINNKGFLFNKINSIFVGVIEILNPRYAFVDDEENKFSSLKKRLIINEDTIQNIVGRITYFRNDIVGQLKLVKVINRHDGIIKRICTGVMLVIGISLEERADMKILKKKREVEKKIKKCWVIKRYKVLRKESREDDVIYTLWDGLKDVVIVAFSFNDELQIAKFYDLTIKKCSDKNIIE